MSRTYRRKNVTQEYYWVLRESFASDEDIEKYKDSIVTINYPRWGGWDRYYMDIHFSETSEEGKKRLAHYHSDAGTIRCKEPGPRFWRNLTAERPLRRYNKQELKKFMKDSDYEPMCLEMGELEYWT